MHFVSHVSVSIWRMGSGDNFTPDISALLDIPHVKEAYRSSNKVNYIWQLLKQNDYMEEIPSYVALQVWYVIDSTEVDNLLSATDQQQSTPNAHLLHLQTIPEEPIIRPIPEQVYHLRETHVHGVCGSIKSTSVKDASEDFQNPNLGQLFRAQSE